MADGPTIGERLRDRAANLIAPAVLQGSLRAIALAARLDPAVRRELSGRHPSGTPWSFRATIAFATADGRVAAHARFRDGRMEVGSGAPREADATVRFRDARALRAFFARGNDSLSMLLEGDAVIEGSLTQVARFAHLAAVVEHRGEPVRPRRPAARYASPGLARDLVPPPTGQRIAEPPAGEVRGLREPALAHLGLDDLPRIKAALHAHRTVQPEVCPERARLLTEHVLDEVRSGRRPGPALRQARVVRHLLQNRTAVVREDDLLAGSTTSKRIGVVLYPETHATTIWPELLTVSAREMNPYAISEETVDVLAHEVFPFWVDSNVREETKRREHDAESLRLDERFSLYFQWKTAAVSHTVADLPAVLRRGLGAMASEAHARGAEARSREARELYRALEVSLDAVVSYSARLATRARELALEVAGEGPEADRRRAELRALAAVCERVPAEPAHTFHEAVQAVWTVFHCLHQENVNAGLSLGRLDLWLDPFLQHDLDEAGEAGRDAAVLRALELVAALMLKLTDHVPLVPEVGNRLFGGSSSDQVITLGGLRPDGSSAVCDATWLFLKATELLGLRDPNMNARYAPGVNSEAYLRRLCEVNAITHATPSIHNDAAMVPCLVRHGVSLEDARDWAATGCVEPTICGKHYGHTGCLMFNAVAPLEMALRDGDHPLVGPRTGPRTGPLESFRSFGDLMAAYEAQLGWLLAMAVDANNRLGRTHQRLKPTPLLSAVFQGPMDSGRDLIDGGAVLNTTGMAVVGVPDVVDSLAAIRTVVFDRRRVELATLVEALEADFVGFDALQAELLQRSPKFGQDDPLTNELAGRIVSFIHRRLSELPHYRGGTYWPGYWSMSNHVAFGLLSGALPSGRRKGKAFAPGLSPSPACPAPLTEQLRAVAALDSTMMPNNFALNVKVVPGGEDEGPAVVDRMAAVVGAYCELGGMQVQFNVTSSETFRSAMRSPAEHRDLLVRISGYNAYFVDLSRPMQLELIERAEHRLGFTG